MSSLSPSTRYLLLPVRFLRHFMAQTFPLFYESVAHLSPFNTTNQLYPSLLVGLTILPFLKRLVPDSLTSHPMSVGLHAKGASQRAFSTGSEEPTLSETRNPLVV